MILAPFRRTPWCRHRLERLSGLPIRPHHRFIHSNGGGSNENENDNGNDDVNESGDDRRDRAEEPKRGSSDRDFVVTSTIPKTGRGVRAGQYATATRTFTGDEVERFGRLIRDFNPLHSSSPVDSKLDARDDDDNLLDLEQRSILEKAGLIRCRGEGGDGEGEGEPTKGALVHGIFVSSLFSSIFASVAPGCVYANQTLEFRAPVFAGEAVVGCVRVARIRSPPRRKPGVVVECRTSVHRMVLFSPASARTTTTTATKVAKDRASRRPPTPQPQGPVEAELVVSGYANVWLPMGYAGSGGSTEKGT